MGSLPLAISVLVLLAAQPPAPDSLTGIVRDPGGRLVPNAIVVVRSGDGTEQRTVTGPDGRFQFPPLPSSADLVHIVRAPGFAEELRRLDAAAAAVPLDIPLAAAGLSETVTVTASRMEQRLRDVPASVNVITQADIRRSPAVVADDVLRQIPTFSLFRRTSSLASHPTAQGVSLRGIGPSGVSRTLVLLDGVPFNDPFGGWVYWTRVPLESAGRIEVVDSASSSLYGNYAMGGVINIVTAPAQRRTFEMNAQYGSLNSPKLDVRASDVWGRMGAVVDASAFTTDGYPTVVERNPAGLPERGLVDTKASVGFANANVKLDYTVPGTLQAFARGGYFEEERVNGKRSTFDGTAEQNDTAWRSASAGIRLPLTRVGDLQSTVFVDDGRFRSNFLAVPAATPPRSIGRITLDQTVPSTAAGGMVQLSRAFGRSHYVTAGADTKWVEGDSRENVLDPVTGSRVTLRRVSGGRQQTMGAFAQDVMAVRPDLTVTLSGRLDRWRNYDARNLETDAATGLPAPGNEPSLPDRDDTVFSPRVAARYQVSNAVSVWGDFGAGFRAPTLNELYRQFRVGTVLTRANNQLGPERLVGGEIGVTFVPVSAVMIRSTWFDNRVEDPVSNVTIGTMGATVVQQRQNLGRTRISGVQNDIEVRVGPFWRFTGGYVYERAKITEYAANPALVGNALPQVPQHRGAVQAVFAHPRVGTLTLAVQAVGRQFDDDLNLRTVPGVGEPGLPAYALVAFTASRSVTRNVDLFVGAQNLLDQEYFVGTLPTTIGTPRILSAGARLRWSGAPRP